MLVTNVIHCKTQFHNVPQFLFYSEHENPLLTLIFSNEMFLFTKICSSNHNVVVVLDAFEAEKVILGLLWFSASYMCL